MRYRFTRLAPGSTSSGRPLAFDDEVDLDDDEIADDYNKTLIDGGLLIPLDGEEEDEQQAAPEQEDAPEEEEPPPEEEPEAAPEEDPPTSEEN